MPEHDSRLDEAIDRLLSEARRIAVVGASPQEDRASYRVPDYLAGHGFEVLPVNARYAGHDLHGRSVAASLAELEGPVDIVDVFRRSEAVPDHLDDILAMTPLPKAVWLQLGIRNDAVAEQLRSAGIEVVQDRCIKIEHAKRQRAQRAAANG